MVPKHRLKAPPPPIPSLAELRRGTCWVWVDCLDADCRHRAPMALAAPVIRWGPAASSDMLRRRARCTRCGGRGATLMLPSWTDSRTGFEAFPV